MKLFRHLPRLSDPDLLYLSTRYKETGNIIDINTIVINRNELKMLLPLWRKLAIRWTNYLRYRRFALNMEFK